MKAQLRQDIDLQPFHIDGKEHHAAQIEDHPKYYISTSGYVISTIGEPRILAERPSNGYMYVQLNGRGELVHRIAAKTLLEEPDQDALDVDRRQVNHLDGDKANNKIANLEWCSPRENQAHYRNVLLVCEGLPLLHEELVGEERNDG